MRFSSWLLSLLVHIAVLALALKMPMGSSSVQIDLDKPVYQVDLVQVPEKSPPAQQKSTQEPVATKEETSKEPAKAQKKAQPVKVQKKATVAKPEAKPISPQKSKAAPRKKKAAEVKSRPEPKQQKKKAKTPAAPTPDQVLAQALGSAQKDAAKTNNAEREALNRELAKLREDIDSQSGASRERAGTPGSEAMRIYARIVEQRIKSNWRFPRIGIQKNLQAIVEVTIDAQGKIVDTNLVSSSGRNDFDNSVLRAVEEAGKLAVPPGEDIKTIKFTFNLQEQR